MQARKIKDNIARRIMCILTISSIVLVILMGAGLYIKSSPIISANSLRNLLLGTNWSPIRNQFGFFPFIIGTIWVTGLAIILALPVSFFTASYLSEYAKPFMKRFVFPILDILAAIPSVVYGVWGTLVVVPLISKKIAPLFTSFSAGYTVLAGGIVLAIMILPLLISLLLEIFSSVSADLRETSLCLGATRWQTAKYVVCRKTMPGIIASVVLSISRALGETIAVLMVCGNRVIIPHSIFDSCYPLPALIANNYGEMLSMPLYESALMFAALILLIVVLLFNLASRMIIYRLEKEN